MTDLPPSPAIDDLVALFDAAHEPWCEFFELSPAEHRAWHMTGYLIRDRARFDDPQITRTWPADLPPFENGYSIDRQLWLYDQPSEYYRRHLLLHEGVHGVMNTLLGGAGSPWYMEGVAELLATHRWNDGRIELAIMPRDREEVPYLGRIKLVQDAVAAGRFFPLATLLEVPPSAFRSDEAYAWVWASALFLDRHPQYGPAFRALHAIVRAPDFTARVRRQLTDDWALLEAQWQVFASELEHGYDFERAALDLSAGRPLGDDSAEVAVAADRGWQNTGLVLEAGRTYRLSAAGRYQLADRPRVWWSEPGGVSIRYYRGRPLGQLLAAVWNGEGPLIAGGIDAATGSAAQGDDDHPAAAQDAAAAGAAMFGTAPGHGTLVDPWSVGVEATIRPAQSGTLLLRINDAPAELSDNAGGLSAQISPLD